MNQMPVKHHDLQGRLYSVAYLLDIIKLSPQGQIRYSLICKGKKKLHDLKLLVAYED